MTTLRSFLSLVLASLVCVSCNIDFMYIGLAGTNWSIAAEEQYGNVHFSPDGRHACVLQIDRAQNAIQVQSGTYDAVGHSVTITDEYGGVINLIRTFSHLKNSKSKNLGRISPVSHEMMDNSVWCSAQGEKLFILFFCQDGNVSRFTYKNTIHKEGYPYGWQADRQPYTLTGSHLSIGTEGATLFSVDFVTDACVPYYCMVPAAADSYSNALAGTFWEQDTENAPGGILFCSDGTYVRFEMASAILFSVRRGTYTLAENKLTLKLDELTESVEISGGKFSFLSKSYRKTSL